MRADGVLAIMIRLAGACSLAIFTGCQGASYATVEFERFADSTVGAGSVSYLTESHEGCELRVELHNLQPGHNYWLCLNALSPKGKDSSLLGNLRRQGWPEGRFDEKGEGYWDFATLTASEDTTCSERFLLPLEPKADPYEVKLLVKDIAARGQVILQAPKLEFLIDAPRPISLGSMVTLGSIVAALLVASFVGYRLMRSRPPAKSRRTDGRMDDESDRKPPKKRWLADAMLLVRDHPEYTDRQIAENIGVHPSQLSRSKEYQRAADLVRGQKTHLPRGRIQIDPDTGLRDVEGYSDN